MLMDQLAPLKEKTGDKPCRCGCAPCDDPCCRLECLVQPRFYCGQLLTDADLQAIVGWAGSKFRLARFRHGWGVVCGLDVRADPKRPAGIVVSPGYAMDCCGNDIIVCEDFRYDLVKYCPDDRCERPGAPPQGRSRHEQMEKPLLDRLISEATILDVAIAYEEQGIEPKVTLGGCGCGNTSKCEHSRTKEGFKLVVTTLDEAEKKRDEAEKPLEEGLKAFEQLAKSVYDGRREARRTLLEWIDKYPLSELTFIPRMIAETSDSDLAAAASVSPILFWMFIDYRNWLVRCACFECTRDTAVPLARIWLQGSDSAAGVRCQVVWIDPRPPYRRLLARERCRPVPPGCIDLSGYLWTDPKYVSESLEAAAAGIKRVDRGVPASMDDVIDLIRCGRTITYCADPLGMYVVDAGVLGKRVAAFCPPETIPRTEGAE